MTYHAGNQLIDPYSLFRKAHVQTDMHVADLGAGQTGHIVFPAAKVVGEKGVVYAVDILKSALASLDKRASMEGFGNIHTVWADLERPHSVHIPKKSLDAVFLVNVLFHFNDIRPILEQTKDLLKQKGRLIIADWTKRLATLGPTEENMLDFKKVRSVARELGFVVQEESSVGGYHRCLVLYQHI